MTVRRRHVRGVVERLVKVYEISSVPVPIERIAQELGVEVRRAHGPDEISGYFMREPGTGRAVIGINTAHHAVRQRFTLAHELGHFLLHDLREIHVDKVRYRNSLSSEGIDAEEIEANEFAAQLLMPERLIRQDLESFTMPSLFEDDALAPMLEEVASKYQVSRAALGFRIINLRG